MRMRPRVVASALAAALAGVVVAVAVGSAGAAPQTVTLGSTNPDGAVTNNFPLCAGSIHCTYLPFSNVATPELQVPFDGTITSFALNSNANGSSVELRVLRPAGGGTYRAVGSSPPETPSVPGVNTFAVSIPVKAGDVLGLDDASDRLMFAFPDSPYIGAYFNPPLVDNSTAASPSSLNNYKLLLQAVVQASTTTTGTTGSTGTTTGTNTNPTPPSLTNVKQSHGRWQRGSKLARFASASKPPIGTTFSFNLSESGTVHFVFKQQQCGARCTRATLSYTANAGAHKLSFQGRISSKTRLPPGPYKLAITATSPSGLSSTASTLSFTIVAG